MKSSFFDSSDHGYMSEVLGRTVNENKESAKKQTEILNLDEELNKFVLGEDVSSFATDGKLNLIKSAVKKGTLSATQATQRIARVYKLSSRMDASMPRRWRLATSIRISLS